MSETLFLQDNLLTEDDWGSLGLADFDSTSPESLANDFYLDDEARYQDFGSYSDDSEGKQGTLVKDQFNHSPPDNQDMVDELLNDLLQGKSNSHVGSVPDYLLKDVEFPQRRYSTNTSSAYSSCSSDPATPPSHSEPASDQASNSSGEHSLEYLMQDHNVLLDSCSDLDTTLSPSDEHSPSSVFIQNQNEQMRVHVTSQKSHPAGNKTQRCRKTVLTSTRKTEESELERAVRLACEETNRLLNMHKSLSGKRCDSQLGNVPKRNKETKKNDILSDLCEKTILGGHASHTDEKKAQRARQENQSKPLKRKASPLQDAIDKLTQANKKPSLLTIRKTQHTPFSRSAVLNSSKVKPTPNEVQIDRIGLVNNEQCIVLAQPQQPNTQQITLDRVTIKPTPGYTITTNPGPTTTPIQLYVKQEPPAVQTYPLINGIIQTTTAPCTLGTQKIYVSPGPNAGGNISLSGLTSPVVVKPEQLLCTGGQTIVVQPPKPTTSSPLQPVNISEMKPGSEPVILSQSDLSRLAAQGVIKFPGKKVERNLKLSTEIVNQPTKVKLPVAPHVQAKPPTRRDSLPSDAAGIINGTSVLIGGTDSQPQRGELDIKALKRHQRMIKNRASACQSRQRRKEYLKTLEDQVTEVAEENRQLREENEQLRVRVKKLQMENTNLMSLIGIQRSNQKRAACVMMLVLFVGVNFFPIGLFGGDPNTGAFQPHDPMSGGSNDGLPLVGQSSSARAGRHLLSLSPDADGSMEMEKSDRMANSSKSAGSGLIVPEKQSFWMDDLVQEYKNKHLEKFVQILSETTSLSTQRMLRRKLKEELGIRIPLPVPRHRRIAYSPRSGRQKVDRVYESRIDKNDVEVPLPSSPAVPKEDVRVPAPLPQPCEQPSAEDVMLNETETSRVNDDLTKWAQRYTVDKQAKARKRAEKDVDAKKNVPNAKAPSSRYAVADNSTTNEIAIYTRPNKKFDDFLDAINRRNDTFYVVSLNRDHLLLPASVQNSSSRMKMALVMPAITSKERLHSSDEYETMIHIECEVLNTRMFELKRKDVPEFLDVPTTKPGLKTSSEISNGTISEADAQIKTSSKRTKKKKTSQRLTKSAEVARKRPKEEQDVQEQEIQRQQEEDAVVTDVIESNP